MPLLLTPVIIFYGEHCVNWDAFGALAEMIGSIAVLSTLVYLSFQIRYARQELKHSIRQNNEAADRELTLEAIRNPELSRVLVDVEEKGDDSFPGTEALREHFDLDAHSSSILNTYLVSRLSLARSTIESDLDFLDESARKTFDRRIYQLFGRGAGRVFFDVMSNARRMQDDVAVVYVRELIARREENDGA